MTTERKCRLILIDDHPIVRRGVRNAMEADPYFQVLGDFGDEKFLSEIPFSGSPDIALLDLSLPGMDGFSIAEQLKELYPACKLVAYTGAHNVRRKLLDAGFDGYVDKTADPSFLLEALKRVCRGEKIYPDDDKRPPSFILDQNHYSKPEYLTSREVEVMKMIAQGYTNKEISRELFISDLTVKTHRRNINQKTGSKNTADLIQFLLRAGL